MTNRRTALRALVATAAATIASPAVLRGRYRLFAQVAQTYSERTIRLVRESIVIDMLSQFVFPDLREEGAPLAERWLGEPASFTAEHFAIFRDSGVNVLALGWRPNSFEEGLRFMARWNGFIASHSQWFTRIDEPRDLRAVKETGKVGIMITTQDSTQFRNATDVDMFYQLGQRVAQLTYNTQNGIGAGFLEHRDGGLTIFGHEIVQRMEQVGMIVDLSHCGDQTTLDAIAAAKKPLLFTHASARALLPNCLRCKTDDMIRALAAKGGVIGVPMIRFMVRAAPPVTVEHVVDHVDYLIKLVGPEHVGVGSDLDTAGRANEIPRAGEEPVLSQQPNYDRYGAYFTADGGAHVDGLNHPKRIFDLTEAMVRRKHSDATIALVLGGSFARVFGEVRQ